MTAPLDDRVRQAAFALLVRSGRPVAVSDLARAVAELPDPNEVAVAVDRLAAAGQLDRDQTGAVVGAGGLTLGDGTHRLLLGGREYHTWCAYDAIGIAAALGRAEAMSTRCAVCARPLAIRFPLAAGAEHPERLWLAAGGDDLRTDFCAPTVLLCSPEHADAWAQRQHGRGRILTLSSAWRLGAGAWAGYAREAERLGVA